MAERIVCRPKVLAHEAQEMAAHRAAEINPVNRPPHHRLAGLGSEVEVRRGAIAALTTKYWHGSGGVRLTVGFLNDAPADLRRRIVTHMNAWGTTADVRFTQSKVDPSVRISREGGSDGGYWSYLGTDILQIPAGAPTMNLEAFTMQTPDAEFHRVVRHETGHTLGFPHEHLRAALVAKIDAAKAIAWFATTEGWSEEETRAQVLTPIEEDELVGTRADARSIMCYQLPGAITTDGKPILGGTDIDQRDHSFAARLYPKPKRRRAPARPLQDRVPA